MPHGADQRKGIYYLRMRSDKTGTFCRQAASNKQNSRSTLLAYILKRSDVTAFEQISISVWPVACIGSDIG